MGAVVTSADDALTESFNDALELAVLLENTYRPDAATRRREMFHWLAR